VKEKRIAGSKAGVGPRRRKKVGNFGRRKKDFFLVS
jgi:hypothetical protein